MMNSSVDEPAVVASALRVRRGRTEVLHSLDVTVERGTITGLLGPSGCGKTTLIRTIVGSQMISGGTVDVLGLPAGSHELRRRVAYTSQSLSIYPDISVRANVTHMAKLLGFGPEHAQHAIEVVELADYADQRVDHLSGGQASRASLACALVGDPELLVLDEPTVGLDPLTRESLWTTFHTLAQAGTTLLISSHVMDEATRCDSVLLMREGRLLAHAPISELQERTHTTNPEEAFMALISAQEEAA